MPTPNAPRHADMPRPTFSARLAALLDSRIGTQLITRVRHRAARTMSLVVVVGAWCCLRALRHWATPHLRAASAWALSLLQS